MQTIRITKALPDIDHPLSNRESLIGLELEADGRAVEELRKEHPHLPRIPNTYEVVLGDLLDALCRVGRDDAMIYWGRVAGVHLIYVPYDCAVVVLERDTSAVTP